MMNNGNYSSGEDDSRGAGSQICCLVEMGNPGIINGERCKNQAGNASYSKRIQKTVLQRRLKLNIDTTVNILNFLLLFHNKKSLVMFFFLCLYKILEMTS